MVFVLSMLIIKYYSTNTKELSNWITILKGGTRTYLSLCGLLLELKIFSLTNDTDRHWKGICLVLIQNSRYVPPPSHNSKE